jgi:SAM-dependent methyltransferase
MASSPNLSILSTMRGWWGQGLARAGFWPTAQAFVVSLWEFVRESTPAQRRQRYGDAEYDWDHRVNTTSATVSWRERLLGQFHSAYQPTEPPLFREMMEMMEFLKINFQELTFIDVGSGKGRVLLMAADYPFRRILGIELLPDLHRVAQENISVYKSDSQQCFAVEAVFGDVREFVFPVEPILLYLFNPLPEAGLIEVITNLEHSLEEYPRTAYVLYHNPLLEHVLTKRPTFTKIGGTHQYSLYRAG